MADVVMAAEVARAAVREMRGQGARLEGVAAHSFFAGMAPAGAPRYVAVVMVDEPKKNGRSGGEAAAPVFAEIMAGALRYAGVRPGAVGSGV